MRLEELLRPHAAVTIVGLAKNAGKTTVVNHLLERSALVLTTTQLRGQTPMLQELPLSHSAA